MKTKTTKKNRVGKFIYIFKFIESDVPHLTKGLKISRRANTEDEARAVIDEQAKMFGAGTLAILLKTI